MATETLADLPRLGPRHGASCSGRPVDRPVAAAMGEAGSPWSAHRSGEQHRCAIAGARDPLPVAIDVHDAHHMQARTAMNLPHLVIPHRGIPPSVATARAAARNVHGH